MKKYLLAALLITAPTFVLAQLEVDSNGNVSLGSQPPVGCAVLNVNGADNSNYNVGIQTKPSTGTKTFNIGLYSYGYPNSNLNSGRSMGIVGVGGNRVKGYNYGVVGGLYGLKNGAGIFGTVTHASGIYINGQYAGYFDGPTYCNETLTSPTFISPSDMTQIENISPLADSKAPSTTLNQIMNMNVISYNFKDKVIPEAERDTISPELAKSMYSVVKNRHYGLLAQELQTIYPDLVYQGQDGTLGVNYVELVPILIQSIQDLKQELDAVKGSSEHKTRSLGDESTDYSAFATGNVLYQNTPNPFKEQTTIRFHLADDVTNAAICIFDMSGKMLKKLPVSLGMTSVTINGYELGEGMFLYTLLVNGMEIDTKRMILSK
jgi:hypothetical protein